MEKVIRDGKVAIVISRGFGAGWYSWNRGHESLLFSPKIIDMIESGKADQIDEDWLEENLGISHVFCAGNSQLEIRWLPIGTVFCVEEYDGSESLRTISDLCLIA